MVLTAQLQMWMVETVLVLHLCWKEIPMGWQEQLDKAIAAIKEAADSETARDIAAKALQSISRTFAPRR